MELITKEPTYVEFIHPKYGVICMELVWDHNLYVLFVNGVVTNIISDLDFYPLNKKTPFDNLSIFVSRYHSNIYRDYVENFLPESLV